MSLRAKRGNLYLRLCHPERSEGYRGEVVSSPSPVIPLPLWVHPGSTESPRSEGSP